MTDREIIDEALRLVDDGVSVTLPVGGSSMLPFIDGGADSVILRKPDRPGVGDVVLAWVGGRRYVLHRIIRIHDSRITLMGDGNISATEQCTPADIKAIATHVVRGSGKIVGLYSHRQRFAAMIWRRMRPIRKYLLAIYRKI